MNVDVDMDMDMDNSHSIESSIFVYRLTLPTRRSTLHTTYIRIILLESERRARKKDKLTHAIEVEAPTKESEKERGKQRSGAKQKREQMRKSG